MEGWAKDTERSPLIDKGHKASIYPFIVKQLLGHSTLATTDRYRHPLAPVVVIDLASMGVVDGCKQAEQVKEKEAQSE